MNTQFHVDLFVCDIETEGIYLSQGTFFYYYFESSFRGTTATLAIIHAWGHVLSRIYQNS